MSRKTWKGIVRVEGWGSGVYFIVLRFETVLGAVPTEGDICVGRLIFIHLQCWEVLPFLTVQRQQCIKFRVLRAQDFYRKIAGEFLSEF